MKETEPTQHIFDLEALIAYRQAAAARGHRVVLTNGCFDLLHRGHACYLAQSAALGHRLLVAVNSDASVRALKGPARPCNSETDRAYLLAALRCVDAVFIFPGPRLDTEIRRLRPDVYTKAGDYTVDTLDPEERRALNDVGTEIHILPFLQGHSTTSLIERAAQQ